MDTLLSLACRRQSCRNFDPSRPVERSKLFTCLEAARMAPSACNSQPWRYVVVDDPTRLKGVAGCLQETGLNRFAADARAFVVVAQGRQNLTACLGGQIKNQPFSYIDIGIAVSHLVLAAQDAGLSSCIVGWFNERRLKGLLAIPASMRIRLVVCLGYAAPDDPLREKIRKPFEEIVRFNSFTANGSPSPQEGDPPA